MAWIARLVLGFVSLLLLFSFPPPLGSGNQISVVAAPTSAPASAPAPAPCSPTQNSSTYKPEGGYLQKSELMMMMMVILISLILIYVHAFCF
jgi:hypothetical protein